MCARFARGGGEICVRFVLKERGGSRRYFISPQIALMLHGDAAARARLPARGEAAASASGWSQGGCAPRKL